jgi:methylated-DNA-[protein]-cysteine S-methyltransferase
MILMEKPTIYWGYLLYKDCRIHLAAGPKGLCHVLWPNKSFQVLEAWTKKHFPKADLVYDQTHLAPYVVEIEDYFEGKRHTFDTPLDLKGTDFQISVWQALLRIPYGTTKSYSEIAQEIHRPKAVRAVGGAIGANPVSIVVPCHRVIGKDKTLTGFGGGLEIKQELLKIEGISNFKK